MKLIKFVNSTVKCNVNFPFELQRLLKMRDPESERVVHIFYSCRLFARWMCRDCEMNQIISCNTKSNQIWLSLIVHSYGASCVVLNSYTSQPFSITVNFDATEKDNERRKRGWKSERSRLFGTEIPSNVVSTRFQYPLSIKKQLYGLPSDDVVMQHSFLFPFHRSNCFLLFLDEIESYNNGVIRFAQNVCVAGIEIFNSSRFFPGRRRRRRGGKTFPSRVPSEHAIKNRDLSEIHLTNWNASGNWNHNRQLDSARCRFNKY